MIYPYERPIVWHVLFHKEKKWWSRKYSHVSLAGRADETWVNVDLHRGGVVISVVHRHDEVQEYLETILHSCDVVRFGPVEDLRSHFLWPMTCVAFVKHALGVRGSALRPDALFRILVRDYDGVWLNGDATDRKPQADNGATA